MRDHGAAHRWLLYIGAVKVDDTLAVEINNHLADVLEAEHGKATRTELEQWATAQGQN